ncbi:hypothetical protein B0H14DRAFT_3440095 [Mycena olivaceomarginata]|nr:hypothetical protein B0H14DRAFT_3440095 [Mycena olivaceomarginata]
MSPQPANGKPAPKAPCKRNTPKHLDGSNGEAPSTAHQAIVDATHTRLNADKSRFFFFTKIDVSSGSCTTGTIVNLIKDIEVLDAVLPTTAAKGTDEDEIHCVLTTVHGLAKDSPTSTFTRRFDIIFKEDAQCRGICI